METRALLFATTARALSDAARAHGHAVPSFRSPPRVPGRTRTIRRHGDGTATVSVVVRDRPWSAVVADMVDGICALNDPPHDALRDLLWAAAEHAGTGRSAGGPAASAPAVTPSALVVVPPAA